MARYDHQNLDLLVSWPQGGDDRGVLSPKKTPGSTHFYGSKFPKKIVMYKSEGLNKHGSFRILNYSMSSNVRWNFWCAVV